MNRSICIFSLCAAFAVAGCDSGRAPQFKLSEQSQGLAVVAQDGVRGELEAGFGTPANLVVWPQLDIDFGQYSGTVAKVGPRPGTLRLTGGEEGGLKPASNLASDLRLPELNGSAVVVVPANAEAAAAGDGSSAGEGDAPVYRVASYDSDSRELAVVDGDGNPAQLNASEGDQIQVVGDSLQHGRNLYLRHCMHCHGVSGDGDGPTAQYFNVRPRDYRHGVIKFTSTKASVPRPSRDDLFRIIKLGVPGTYMPSFMLLPDEDVQAIGEYVRWLAMRGEMERKLNAWLNLDYSQDAIADSEMSAAEAQTAFAATWADEAADNITQFGEELQGDWKEAENSENVVLPSVARVEASSESIERGRKLFMGDKAKCASCHGETGRGNGPSTESFNDLPGQPGVKSDKPGLFDIWGNIVKPRDLTTGIYRGGRRPIDLYRRIHSGIKGTPMQAFGTTLKEEEIWDVVNFVLSVPFENTAEAGHH